MPSSGVQTCARSEEHTSELQSHDNLVCRLLLEKKIDMVMRVLFRAHRRPDPLGQKIGQRLTADAPADEGQHVRIDGLVRKRLAVFALLLLPAQEIEDVG